MIKQTAVIALAFIGLVVGAGFASGQEVLQFFVAFGIEGIWGALLAAFILGLAGMVILQLGSYFQAKEHSIVFNRVAHPVVSRLLDAFTVFTLFSIGFVMIAGAGANLNQQFGFPLWVGAALMSGLIIAAGFLDVTKVTTVIGGITPFIVVFVIMASIYAFVNASGSIADMEPVAQTVQPALPHWLLSTLNYVCLALALAVSMALVMGGDLINLRVAGVAGLIGGGAFGILLVISVLALFSQIDNVKDAPMPMLELVNSINPALGVAMAIIIYGMIFNTAIGMYYALAKRVSASRPKLFVPAMIVLTLIGFALSFAGFETLVSYLYPIIGYAGMLIVGILVFAWIRERGSIKEEEARRFRIRDLLRRKWERGKKFTPSDDAKLRKALKESNIDDRELHREISRRVVAQIELEEGAEVEDRWEKVAQRWDAEAAEAEAQDISAAAESAHADARAAGDAAKAAMDEADRAEVWIHEDDYEAKLSARAAALAAKEAELDARAAELDALALKLNADATALAARMSRDRASK